MGEKYRIDILTLFPAAVEAMLGESILGRAGRRGLISIECHQIRDYTTNKQMQVDDYPYGGGRGCVMQAQPLYDCWAHVCKIRGERVHTIYMSPCGKPFNQADAKRLRDDFDKLILVCGHYEGVDQRFIDECVDEEISLGDFVLTGGEIPAMAVADAVCRLVPGVLPDETCFTEESHWAGLLEYPQYSRPEEWQGRKVPSVLLSGNHAEIRKWRIKQSIERTFERRPDMFRKLKFETKQEKKLLLEMQQEREETIMNELLEEYVKLIVKTGLNLQVGQTLLITAPVDAADFTRRVVREAYRAGAREVEVRWRDSEISRETYLNASDDVFDTVRPWRADILNTLSEEGAAFLTIDSDDPEAYAGVDPERMRRAAIASGAAIAPFRSRQMTDEVQWCIVSVPNLRWARKMFPGMGDEKAVKHQWDAILKAVRVTKDVDAEAAWAEHSEELRRRVEKLNSYAFKYLCYKNSLGTDLTVELPEGHYWDGANSESRSGVTFVPNMPTEEVFTVPKRDGVNGVVYASRPLVLNGGLVDRFSMVFKDGRITEFHAGKGEELLRAALDTDEGSRYLGEVALVPYSSPISQSGLLFYNTLFDENASCHLAFGACYPCVKGAAELSAEDRKRLGLNDSIVHEDFMVGTRDLAITGITCDGQQIPVFVDGDFAF